MERDQNPTKKKLDENEAKKKNMKSNDNNNDNNGIRLKEISSGILHLRCDADGTEGSIYCE